MHEYFDIEEYLQDRNITYTTSGKNTTRGWINIQCPFCLDHSNHLGINTSSRAFNCWICGESGYITDLIQEIDGCSKKEALYVVDKQFQNKKQSVKKEIASIRPSNRKKSIVLPKESTSQILEAHKRYLERRNFDPEYLVKRYGIRFCGPVGKYKYRVIVPVYYEGQIVNFVARDITDKAEIRYRGGPDEEAAIPLKDLLYNFDMVGRRAILVEGVFDAWRFDRDCVASLGTALTKKQLNDLATFDRLIIVFDGGALDKAKWVKRQLNPFVPEIEVIQLKEDLDPCDLTRQEALEIRKEFLDG
jgi:DNA primase